MFGGQHASADSTEQEHGGSAANSVEKESPDQNSNGLVGEGASALERDRDESAGFEHTPDHSSRAPSDAGGGDSGSRKQSQLMVQIYTHTWLVFFSILGTLARLGTQWITAYPNALVVANELWANVGGCVVMGFLIQDRALFRPVAHKPEGRPLDAEKIPAELSGYQREHEREQAAKVHLAHKKTLPLYIGLSVGFCGSYTSFSSFMRDAFLALSNDLAPKNASGGTRSAGWSACAVLAVIIAETGLSLAALSFGAHACRGAAPILRRIPAIRLSHILDPLGAALGVGCWLGAVFLAVWPPRGSWRGDCVFAIVFAPLGCLLRFWLAIKLNARVARFPIGTCAANVSGSIILAMAFDLQHAPLSSAGGLVGGGLVGCQVLQGIMDGFCGCLTTVSTWVAELKTLRKRHAYEYGLVSIVIGFVSMLVIIGPLHWTVGLSRPVCAS